MTHLGLGSSLEDPWGLVGGSGDVVFPGDSVVLLGSWVTLCLLECLRPCLLDLFGLLD